MMKKLLADVEVLSERELALASVQHGDSFHSAHEAYGVIKEEVEEASEVMKNIEVELEQVWHSVRRDKPMNYDMLFRASIHGACELIQVAAMALKAKNSHLNESQNKEGNSYS